MGASRIHEAVGCRLRAVSQPAQGDVSGMHTACAAWKQSPQALAAAVYLHLFPPTMLRTGAILPDLMSLSQSPGHDGPELLCHQP